MQPYTDEQYEAMSEKQQPTYSVAELAELFMLKQQIYPEGRELLLLAILGRTQDANNRSAVKNWIAAQMQRLDTTLPRRDFLDVLIEGFEELVLDLSE